MSFKPTWDRRIIFTIIGVAILYGLWFNVIDTLVYNSVPVGIMIPHYQIWNVIGHLIPGLFFLFMYPKKFELFIVSVLVSTFVMDCPLWGVERIELGHTLWPVNNLSAWILFYYNPVGNYGVWSGTIPTASMIFWSLVARLVAAVLIIIYQHKLEHSYNKQMSIFQLL